MRSFIGDSSVTGESLLAIFSFTAVEACGGYFSLKREREKERGAKFFNFILKWRAKILSSRFFFFPWIKFFKFCVNLTSFYEKKERRTKTEAGPGVWTFKDFIKRLWCSIRLSLSLSLFFSIFLLLSLTLFFFLPTSLRLWERIIYASLTLERILRNMEISFSLFFLFVCWTC